MVKSKFLVYTSLVVLPALTLALGCGNPEPTQPPAGAPTTELAEPAVDLGGGAEAPSDAQ